MLRTRSGNPLSMESGAPIGSSRSESNDLGVSFRSVDSDEETLTIAEAYRAIFLFLEADWRRGGERSDEIAAMLGSMAFLQADGGTMDPAYWSDWEAAVPRCVGRRRIASRAGFRRGLRPMPPRAAGTRGRPGRALHLAAWPSTGPYCAGGRDSLARQVPASIDQLLGLMRQ